MQAVGLKECGSDVLLKVTETRVSKGTTSNRTWRILKVVRLKRSGSVQREGRPLLKYQRLAPLPMGGVGQLHLRED
jgi:hypothetical protein